MVRLTSSERSTILLLGCAKSKLTTPAAKELYCPSNMFRARRRFAEERGAPWFILSSKWGLLDPAQMVAPYEMYLAGQPVGYRKAWGEFVVQQLLVACPLVSGDTVEMHAGADYVAPIRAGLESRGILVATPLQGLSRGPAQAWYKNHRGALDATE